MGSLFSIALALVFGCASVVAGVGDENGDGFDDILIGANREGDAGVSYLVLGRSF
jgi:hypothetical protein